MYAYAAILRFLSPVSKQSKEELTTYVGQLDGHKEANTAYLNSSAGETITYADGLRYNLSGGWYEFRCNCCVEWSTSNHKRHLPLPDALAMLGRGRQPSAYTDVVRSYLFHPEGGNLISALMGDSAEEESERVDILETFVSAVSTLYARMVCGDSTIDILNEMMEKQTVYSNGLATSCEVLVDGHLSEPVAGGTLHYKKCPIPHCSHLMNSGLHGDDIVSAIISEVRGQEVVDLHTHLLPPSHGSLCLWGIDELLTYHYLVAEYFMTSPAEITPEDFYALNKEKQVSV